MTRRLLSQSNANTRLAAVFLLTIFLTAIFATPSQVHAKPLAQQLGVPDVGGPSGSVAPGQGDDDQPTGEGEGGQHTNVASKDLVARPGGAKERGFTGLSFVKTLIVRSGSFVIRWVGFAN